MRLGTGLLILAVGGVGLGWLTHAHYAPYMQAVIESDALTAMGTTVHGAQLRVEGRDIWVSGLADGPTERARIIAALDAVEGRRVVHDELEVLPVVQPFVLDATWDGAERRMTLQGHAPTAADLSLLSGLGTADLTLAAGAPPRWAEAAAATLAALSPLETGRAQVSGTSVSMVGLARTPEEGSAVTRALGLLPPGFEPEVRLSYIDDGTPPAYTVFFRAERGVRVEGKVPVGVDGDDLAEALGLSSINMAATQALMGPQGAVDPALAALAPWMRDLEAFEITVGQGQTAIAAQVGAGSDVALVTESMNADLAASGADLSVVLAEASGADGDTRVNAVTGQTEVLSGGYWLAVSNFEPGADTCMAEANAALASNRIGFVTGSAQLDARARGAVNALASIMVPCVAQAGLTAEIGGHTDNTGSEEGNNALSQARADAVVAALVARGLPAAALSAQGYGASQPIASNDTDEGRAANRRTTVTWAMQ